MSDIDDPRDPNAGWAGAGMHGGLAGGFALGGIRDMGKKEKPAMGTHDMHEDAPVIVDPHSPHRDKVGSNVVSRLEPTKGPEIPIGEPVESNIPFHGTEDESSTKEDDLAFVQRISLSISEINKEIIDLESKKDETQRAIDERLERVKGLKDEIRKRLK